MNVKRSGKKIFGANLTAAERKGLAIEIKKELADYDHKHALEIDAIVLWVLHNKYGFGIKRLREFYDNFNEALNDLTKRYEMDESDKIWLCTHKLKECGIDLEKWMKEKQK